MMRFRYFAHWRTDLEVGLEIELEDPQRVLDVLRGVGDRDQRQDRVAFLHVVLDPLARDHDVALDELEAGVAQAVAELVVAHVHAVHLPVLLLEDGVGERAADEAVGAENEDFEGHGEKLTIWYDEHNFEDGLG